jgi:hypothetical protein
MNVSEECTVSFLKRTSETQVMIFVTFRTIELFTASAENILNHTRYSRSVENILPNFSVVDVDGSSNLSSPKFVTNKHSREQKARHL